LDSAKSRHIEPCDQLADKKTNDVIKINDANDKLCLDQFCVQMITAVYMFELKSGQN